jgi:hypothetical protein
MRLPRILLGVLAAVACGALVWVVVVVAGTEPRPRAGAEARPPGEPEDLATVMRALRQWDEGRARAWARADLAALRSLYAPGSAAGARDVRMLRQWRDRGLRVEGMQTQVLGVEVVAQSPDRLVLVVTDRLARAVAAGRGHRVVLPADGATSRRMTLGLVDRVWRVTSVLPEESAKP